MGANLGQQFLAGVCHALWAGRASGFFVEGLAAQMNANFRTRGVDPRAMLSMGDAFLHRVFSLAGGADFDPRDRPCLGTGHSVLPRAACPSVCQTSLSKWLCRL